MRILNRPMFKYGGPIKEGVMHGMRNGGSIAGGHQIGIPMGDRTGFQDPYSKKKIFGFEIPGTGIALDPATNRPYDSKYIQEMLKKERDKSLRMMSWMFPAGRAIKGAGWSWKAGAPAIKKLFQGPVSKSKELTKYTGPVTRGSDKWFGNIFRPAYQGIKQSVKGAVAPLKEFKTALGLGIPAAGYGLAKGYEAWKKRQAIDAPDLDDTTTTETTSRWDDTAPIITASQREKLAKDAQNKRLKSYLDMMGYDSAKKTALSDALIDASAIVQQGTEEAGSLKESDWGKMINKAIQTTSRRLDKPAQIREAVGLMMTKCAIEKDIAEGKGGALKQNARDLVDAGVYKTEKEAMKHLAKKTSFEDVLIAIAGKQGDVTGAHLEDAWRMSESGIPKARVKATDEIYENFVDKNEKLADIELEFVDREIKDKQPGDVYVIDDRMVIIQADGTPKYRW
jgi:hypothetical protein